MKRHQHTRRLFFLFFVRSSPDDDGSVISWLQCRCEREGSVVGNMSTSICAGICVFMSTCTQTCEWLTKRVVNHVTLWLII